MHNNSSQDSGDQFSLKSIIPFLIITFGLAWGIIALYILLNDQMTAIFGQLSGSHPLFFLAVYAPAIAAISIIIKKTGLKGLQSYFSRLSYWRTSIWWYLFLLIGIPIVFYGGSAWKGNLFTEPFPFDSAQALMTAFFLSIIKGPIEEFGWRGFVQPIMQRKLAPIWAAITIGIIWGIWHLPAFMLSGTQQSAWSFAPFFAGTIAISIIMTPLYNSSRGSILLPAIMHFQLMNPIWPDAQPYDTYILVPVSLVIVWIYRNSMFNKDGAVTQVLPN